MSEILKGGWLSFPPHNHSIDPGQIEIDSLNYQKINDMFNPHCVCFADIPKTELKIHIKKYSRFGIAFYKPFLIEKGANPVFYIEENSNVYKNDFSFSGDYNLINRVDYYQEFCNKTKFYFLQKYLNKSNSGDEYRDTMEIWRFLVNLFSHFKVWNNNLEDDELHNYYFEREWRTTNNINFQLSDIVMIILPEKYENQFKINFPEYAGELIRAEDLEKGA